MGEHLRDVASVQAVLDASHLGEAKQRGRDVLGFDEATWAANRVEIVVAGSLAKFSQH